MRIKIGVSNRHMHITKEVFNVLFGQAELVKAKDLVQPGEFASTLKVTIKTEKDQIENVRVLGPFRDYTQVEISKTDSYKLGINPPIRNSGDLNNAEEITIIGSIGEIKKKCCIIATRHIHMTKEQRKDLGLSNVDYVSIQLNGEKSSILKDVYIKECEKAVVQMHIDTDDANSCFIKDGDFGELII